MKKFKKIVASALVVATLAPSVVFAKEDTYGKAKNIILMIPDGMSVEALTTARWMTDEHKFVMDSMATGLVRTNNANTPIADSAPAGTSMATGIKTVSPFVGIYPSKAEMPGSEGFDKSKAMMPIANVLEGAERIGKATGIVSTSNIQHATPADFSAHHPDRNNYEDLGEQQVYQNMEVVLGGGSEYINGSKRADKEDLISEIKGLSYDYVTTADQLKNSKADKIWGMFADKSLAYDIDRNPAVEPSLAEMTDKALSVLSKDEDGFFLMVEGSEVDWAAHANDPVGIASEVKAFDKAVKVAKDFADKHGDTVIIIASDHGTGGITFGHRDITKGYDKAPLESFTHIIKNAKLTGQGVAAKLDKEKSNIAQVMQEAYGIKDLTAEEIKSIKEAKDVQFAVGTVVSNRSNIGWTTGGHVGGDVALYCYSTAQNAKKIGGTIHNKEIATYIEDLFDMNLNELTNKLYQPARAAFEAKGAKVEFKNITPGNSAIEVTKDNQKILLPISKNYAIVDGKKVEIGGLTIFNTKAVYVPQGAIDLIK